MASDRAQAGEHGPVWLALRDPWDLQSRARLLDALDETARAELPLYGMTFGVKDNIDVEGLPTTAGCPAYSYMPAASAPAVEHLERAGAICLGKTHLDQFATGLVGTRSPHGPLRNPFDPRYVSGGSSSGSAVAVALGHVTFALGTDTAGSGRIPAAFNNLVGIKPSRGLVSTRGIVPACASLDCVSIFGIDLDTAWRVLRVATGSDAPPYTRELAQRPVFEGGPRLAVLDTPGVDDPRTREHFAVVRSHWLALGAQFVDIDPAPFFETARLLYDGPWVAERDAAFGAFVATHPAECDPCIRTIIEGARHFTATDAFRAMHRLRELQAHVGDVWRGVDALLVPSAPSIPRLSEVERDPIGANAALGVYANFVNLLDLAAIAVPAGFRSDGLPGGFTLIAPAGSDHALAVLAHRYLRLHPNRLGVSTEVAEIGAPPAPMDGERDVITLAVAGAHMRGMPLNHELIGVGARFEREARTSSRYRLVAIDGPIPKPGLVRSAGGAGIALELWQLPTEAFGRFVARVPPPMAIGTVELEDGTWVKGFVCEPIAVTEASDITSHGGWRAYCDAKRGATLAT